MKRWTKSARMGEVPYERRDNDGNDIEVARSVRQKKIYFATVDLASAGEYDDIAADMAMKGIAKLTKQIMAYKSIVRTTCQVGYNIPFTEVTDDNNNPPNTAEADSFTTEGLHIYDRAKNIGIEVGSIKAPIIKKKAGRPSNKRYMSFFETNFKKTKGRLPESAKAKKPGGRSGIHQTRFCSCCKSPDHDLRTCPNRPIE